jgi:hypothetical protein
VGGATHGDAECGVGGARAIHAAVQLRRRMRFTQSVPR